MDIIKMSPRNELMHAIDEFMVEYGYSEENEAYRKFLADEKNYPDFSPVGKGKMWHNYLSGTGTVLGQSEQRRIIICYSVFLEDLLQFLTFDDFCRLISKLISLSGSAEMKDIKRLFGYLKSELGYRMNPFIPDESAMNFRIYDTYFSNSLFLNAVYSYSSCDREYNRECDELSPEEKREYFSSFYDQKLILGLNKQKIHGFLCGMSRKYAEVNVQDFSDLDAALAPFRIIMDDHQWHPEEYDFVLCGLNQRNFDRSVMEDFMGLLKKDARTLILITDRYSSSWENFVLNNGGNVLGGEL